LILTLPQEDVGALDLFSNSSANPHVQFLQAFFFFGPDPHSAARYDTITRQILQCVFLLLLFCHIKNLKS